MTAADELTRPRVLATLEDLGTQRASGVLEVEGAPSGAIYLERGLIAFARASPVPGLVSRARGVLQPTAEVTELLRGWDPADPGIGTLLVQRRLISRQELHALLGSIIVDAVMVLTVPLAGGSHVSGIRFVPAGTHWAETFPRLRVDSVRAEAVRRAENVVGYGLSPLTPVALKDLSRPTAILTRERWAIAARMGAAISPRDLAQECGLSLSETIERLGDLIRVGMCVPVPAHELSVSRAALPVRPRAPHAAGRPAAGHAAGPAAGPAAGHAAGAAATGPVPTGVMAPPPAAHPAGTRAAAAHAAGRPRPPRRAPEQSPPAEILRQVLNGLKKLS